MQKQKVKSKWEGMNHCRNITEAMYPHGFYVTPPPCKQYHHKRLVRLNYRIMLAPYLIIHYAGAKSNQNFDHYIRAARPRSKSHAKRFLPLLPRQSATIGVLNRKGRYDPDN
jgi:hypothetical protein